MTKVSNSRGGNTTVPGDRAEQHNDNSADVGTGMTNQVLDVIPVEQARTLHGLFLRRVDRTPGKLAYRSYNRLEKQWEDQTWAQMADTVARWRDGFASCGFSDGGRVALAMRNCPEWVAFDQGAMAAGLVTVPLYTEDRADNMAYILEDSACGLLLVENIRMWKRVRGSVLPLDFLKRILILEANPGDLTDESDQRVMRVDDWLPESAEPLQPREEDPNRLASIVYTSGTSGPSKGVMLSHHNMLSDAWQSLQSVPVYTSDLFLSFLPLSHTLERTVGYYVPMMAGASVAYARSVNQLAEDLVTIRPTAMISVPRVFERVHGRIQQQMEKGSAVKRALFNLTVKVGWARFEALQGRGRRGPSQMLWPALEKAVAGKVMDKLGGRVRCAICGGAALPYEIAKTFIALGLPLLQGYGLTEFSPVASVNHADNNDPKGVGPALQGVDVRIGDKDELLLKGPSVMLGYWNNHTATQQAIDNDGWLHTGDCARLENGHIYITGRIKDIIVMSNGEKLPPGDMEAAICLDSLFEQAIVLGEGRAYLTAIVVLSEEAWPEFAEEMGVSTDADSLQEPKVQQAIQKRVTELLKDFPGYAKVRKVTPILEPFSVDNGMLTPTMKLKRKIVLERYDDDIQKMYATEARA